MRVLIGRLILFLLLLASCKPQQQASQAAPTPQLTGSCTIGKWSTLGTTPLNLKMSSDFIGDFTGADFVGGLNPIEQVANAWNTAISGKSFFKVPFDTATTSGYPSVTEFKDSELGIYKSHNWFSNVSSQALAITQFYGYVRTDSSLGNYIDLTHADIIVNYRDFGPNLTMHLPASTGNYDLPTIVIHEMGHFLGLCHEANRSPLPPISIMEPYYYSTQRVLMARDKTKINDLYSNNTITPLIAKVGSNAIAMPEGTPVRGIIELRANGKCMHYINGKLVYEH
jgi:hypothetical protein